MQFIFKSTINIVSKNLVVFNIFLEKFLKLYLYHCDFDFKVIFILILILYHCFTLKKNNKRYTIRFYSFSSLKIIFELLEKILVIYIQVFIIEVRKSSFKELFAKYKTGLVI